MRTGRGAGGVKRQMLLLSLIKERTMAISLDSEFKLSEICSSTWQQGMNFYNQGIEAPKQRRGREILTSSVTEAKELS